MIRYKLFLKNPASHYIYVDLIIDNISSDTLNLQLPAWRPGRYELGNFAKNVKRVDAFDGNDQPLEFTKLSKDKWQINTKGVSVVKVTYSYFANEPNAGACYADEFQLYVNPVHLCMYVPERMNEPSVVELDIPDNYKIACALPVKGKTLRAKNFDELADSPFFASPAIKSDSYEVQGITFHLHFNGECKPDMQKIKKDFIAFTKAQIEFWGDFPVKEYHFLFFVLPHKFYHGVEHEKSTVIALGPGYGLNHGKMYEDLVGVSSHELFHTWNVKSIRPAEMYPYDFSKENYARTGYVYEGFTTYYGDVMLRRSNVFTDEQYFETLEERLVKHFHNYGRYNLSVAQSSWETWLDGYVPGSPYRKTNIYDEGNLIAFMLDIMIMRQTENQRSLKEVCRMLYNDFAKKGKGYTEHDIIELCEKVSGRSFKDFFKNYVYGTEDYEPQLNECFTYVGLEMQKSASNSVNESKYGFKVVDQAPHCRVTMVAPFSPSWKFLSINDEVISVNGFSVKNDLNQWLKYFDGEEVDLMVSSAGKIKIAKLKASSKGTFFDSYKLAFLKNTTEQQKKNYKLWLGF
jgi:predicted metalloprotease with PDZ domain